MFNIDGTHFDGVVSQRSIELVFNIGHNSMFEEWLTVRDPTT